MDVERISWLLEYANVLKEFLGACSGMDQENAEKKFMAVCDELDKELRVGGTKEQ